MRPTLDEYFMAMALVAASRATCARRRVGCVLVDAGGVLLSSGYNGPARGMPHCTDSPCPGALHATGQGLDECDAVHAEQNALVLCRSPRDLHTCYVTASPCVPCAKLLLNSTCRRVAFLEEYPGRARELWVAAGRAWDPVLVSPWLDRVRAALLLAQESFQIKDLA